ncbi:MAG: hypothetical protein H0W83_11045, partial [Planctomycetes bacterium]|nr:hypothetical protein [Planctomycetota bacterium]
STLVDATQAADGLSLPRLREVQGNGYGWQYFGTFLKEPDVRCSACHYDWGGSAWLHFLRTGDQRFADEARILTRHHADLDQYHVANDQWHDGMQCWEGVGSHYPGKRPFHAATVRADGSYTHVLGAAQCYTHTWSGSFALGYLLTGDRRLYDALERTLGGARDWWWGSMKLGGEKPVPCDQTRSQGWCILHFLNLYRITGENQLIVDAYRLFAHSLLATEWKRTGCFAMSDGHTIQTFFIYPIEPLVDLHFWATRAGLDTSDLSAFLRRWCDYARDRFYAPPRTTEDGRYFPWRNDYSIALDGKANPDSAFCLRFHTMSCSAFAYLGWLLRASDPEASAGYTRVARELFRDRYLYTPTNLAMSPEDSGALNAYGQPIQGQRPAPFDPAFRYPISFRYCIPDQLEKEQGWAMRGSQPLLWTLAQEEA